MPDLSQPDLDAAKKGQQATEEIPFGPVKGALRSLPQFENLGQVRPFGPGEYLETGPGSMASEMSVTVPYENNQWAVLPGLWIVNGVPTRINEDQATEYAKQSGLIWPTFPSQDEADKFATEREAVWEKTPHGRTDLQRPLWSRKWPPQRAH